MSKYNIEIGSDGCPNDCGYCRDMQFPYIYENENSPLEIKEYTCCICGKKIGSKDTYSFKDNDYCESCFDEVVENGNEQAR